MTKITIGKVLIVCLSQFFLLYSLWYCWFYLAYTEGSERTGILAWVGTVCGVVHHVFVLPFLAPVVLAGSQEPMVLARVLSSLFWGTLLTWMYVKLRNKFRSSHE